VSLDGVVVPGPAQELRLAIAKLRKSPGQFRWTDHSADVAT
jgi:hypothetical protein